MRSALIRFFFTIAVALMVTAQAQSANTCARLAQALQPSGFTFPNDRTHLIVPLDLAPGPYFKQPILNPPGYLMERRWGWTPSLVIQLGYSISNRVVLSKPSDFLDALERGYVYTYVLTHEHLIIGRIPKSDRERYSKHVVLSNREGVLGAGELWMEEDGTLAASNASGSYTPPYGDWKPSHTF